MCEELVNVGLWWKNGLGMGLVEWVHGLGMGPAEWVDGPE